MTQKNSNLVTRVLTAVVAIPLLLGILFAAPPWATFVLIAAASFLVCWEYCTITYAGRNRAGRLVASLLTVLVAAVLYFAPAFFLAAAAGSFVVIFLLFLFHYEDQKTVSLEISSSLTGILYGGVVLTTLSLLGRDAADAGSFWVLLVMIVVWSSDTGAYFAGRGFGKHKLYPAVSPNKTVEGAIGGIIASVGVGFLFNGLFGYAAVWQPMQWWQVLVLTIPANLLAQMGDLAESLIKRAHQVKDSGNIIPGHGGMLDRIDGLIFAAPWFYIFFTHVLH